MTAVFWRKNIDTSNSAARGEIVLITKCVIPWKRIKGTWVGIELSNDLRIFLFDWICALYPKKRLCLIEILKPIALGSKSFKDTEAT